MSEQLIQDQKLLPLNSPSHAQNTIELNLSTPLSHVLISNSSSSLNSSEDTKSIETTKSELIQRILDSFKSSIPYCKSFSNDTTGTSLSSIDETETSHQLLNLSNEIYIHFPDKNELGFEPHIDDLLEKLDSTKICLCHRVDIILNNQILNQQLSYKQKQSILRIILRRQQILDRYFS